MKTISALYCSLSLKTAILRTERNVNGYWTSNAKRTGKYSPFSNLSSQSSKHSATWLYPVSTSGEDSQLVLKMTNDGPTLTCTYSDLQDQLITLNNSFPKQKKKCLSACCYREDHPNWVTLTGDRVRRSYVPEMSLTFSR